MSYDLFTYHVFRNNDKNQSFGESLENSEVYRFWHHRWSEKFSASGNPPSDWEADFSSQDLVTWLTYKGEVTACHLYSFYELNQISDAEYFNYLNPQSVQAVLHDFGPRTMTMEYLCASGATESVPLSLGATMISLGSRLALEEGCGSVLGMPIDGTSVSRKVTELGMGARCVEEGIQKYGYRLRLLATDPAVAKSNEPDKAREWLDGLWLGRADNSRRAVPLTA